MQNLNFILSFVVFIYLGVLTWYILKIARHYNRLIGKTGKNNLSQILDELLDRAKRDEKKIASLESKQEQISKEIVHHVQKVGILRFNPFADTGGDQSFVFAILDGNDTGIVLTSLHSRGTTRWYAKNVKKGKGVDFDLSQEEEKTIKTAVSLKYGKEENSQKAKN